MHCLNCLNDPLWRTSKYQNHHLFVEEPARLRPEPSVDSVGLPHEPVRCEGSNPTQPDRFAGKLALCTQLSAACHRVTRRSERREPAATEPRWASRTKSGAGPRQFPPANGVADGSDGIEFTSISCRSRSRRAACNRTAPAPAAAEDCRCRCKMTIKLSPRECSRRIRDQIWESENRLINFYMD